MNPADDALSLLKGLRDPLRDPDDFSRAGWGLVRRGLPGPVEDSADLQRIAACLENDELALTLLQESPVPCRTAEAELTRVRRWLCLSGSAPRYSALTGALRAQAELNGGAWLFGEDERDVFSAPAGQPLLSLYLPGDGVPGGDASGFRDDVTRAVAAHYERWPYPAWRRINVPQPCDYAAMLTDLGAESDGDEVSPRSILVAGCGTGRETVWLSHLFPAAAITAIDISEASLGYARRRHSTLGAGSVQFLRLDLHNVASLGTQFDYISSGGVLHHLPDPEAGWAALDSVLRPGGVMHLMLYSATGRMLIKAARRLIADLLADPVTADRLREVRRRIMENARAAVFSRIPDYPDFSSLQGVYDLLMHRHEDPFDVARIERAAGRFGLRLLRFEVPGVHRAAFESWFPESAARRDFSAWHRFEVASPFAFEGGYDFWCQKPRACAGTGR